VTAVVPLTTLGYLIAGHSETSDPESRVEATPHCMDIEKLAKVDEATAIARYEALRDAEASNDATKYQGVEDDRKCALQALKDLQDPTVVERLYSATEDAVSQLAKAVTGEGVRLGDSPNAAFVAGLVAFQLLLLCVAVRHFVLWRGERLPGPVEVADIAAPDDDKNRTALADTMRVTLADAGIAPGTSAPGELRAVVVDALAASKGPQGWLGGVLSAFANALNPPTGFNVSARAFRHEVSKKCCVSVRATSARTKETIKVFTSEGESYEEAATEAAYDLYLELVQRDSVYRRTPRWLHWTSTSGLRSYAAGRRDELQTDKAIAHFKEAVEWEPSNVLVLISLAQAMGDRAKEVPNSGRPQTARGRRDLLEAVKWALLAVHSAPHNDDALFSSAVRLAYVEHWIAVWRVLNPQERHDFGRLMEVAIHRTRWWRRHWQFAADGNDHAAAERKIREASRILLRHTLAGQRYWNVLRMWWTLAERRETIGRIAPWARVRFSRRHTALGILDGITWDQFREVVASQDAPMHTYVAVVFRSAFRRFRIRVGNAIFRDPDHFVDWNLTLSYACQIRAMAAFSSNSPAWLRPVTRAALRGLSHSLLSATTWLDSWELKDAVETPDLCTRDENQRLELEQYVADWLWPLWVPERDERGRGGTRRWPSP